MTNNYAKRINSAEVIFFDRAAGIPERCSPPEQWVVWKRVPGMDPRFRVVGENARTKGELN